MSGDEASRFVTLSARRTFSFEQKQVIVAEARASQNISAVARRHKLKSPLLFRWLREFPAIRQSPARSAAAPSFIPVTLALPAGPAPAASDASAMLPPDRSAPDMTSQSAAPNTAPNTAQVVMPRPPVMAEIVLANGRTVRIAADADPGAIARLVAALEGVR
jgi:transposase-like protein